MTSIASHPQSSADFPQAPVDEESWNVDRVVQSVTNASKRLSQISTNTNNSNKKRKSQNRIGPWKLGRTLGRGSTGRVRLAKNINTGKLAAVKIVPKSNFKKLENPKYRNLAGRNLPYGIEREIIIMKLINHPNIMGLFDVWENKNDLYLILEYIEGGELFDYMIKRGKLQEYEAVNYFKQIIHGISYLHQFNICHRDLKPENLLLDFNKNIKIADFGMAALEVNEKLLETSCGSPHYASPEIVAGKNYHGAPSDIWSCGIILFALLTGHLPFDDENIRKLLLKVQNGKFIMPANLSAEAKDLISRMLRVDPDQRITIEGILKHPLLTKYPNNLPSSAGGIGYHNLNIKPLNSSNKVDKEILKNLSILFHNCDEEVIMSRLLSHEKNPEKVFYYLLMKYRNDHIDDNLDLSSGSIIKSSSRSPEKSLKKSTSSKKALNNITNTSNSFKASNSFNKKKSMKLNESITISRSSSKPVQKLTRKLTGNELSKMIHDDKENNISAMERHERRLAKKVHDINEARALKYEQEKQKESEQSTIPSHSFLSTDEDSDLSQKDSNLEHSDTEPSGKRLPPNAAVLSASPRRNVTEPPLPSQSLDPRIAGISSLLRAKSLAAPSSYASLRRTGVNENTTKVLKNLGIELNQPFLVKKTVKTSSSMRLSSFIDKENMNISLKEFNVLEKPVAKPAQDAVTKPSQDEVPNLTPKYSSLLSDDKEGTRKKSTPPTSALPNRPDAPKGIVLTTEAITSAQKMSPVRSTFQATSTNLSQVFNSKRPMIPNPRFSRFSFNGLLNSFNPESEIYNNVNVKSESGTVVRHKSKSQLKKSTTIDLKGLATSYNKDDEFISVSVSDNEEETNNTTLMRNAITDQGIIQENEPDASISRQNILDTTSLADTINVEENESNEFEISKHEQDFDDEDEQGSDTEVDSRAYDRDTSSSYQENNDNYRDSQQGQLDSEDRSFNQEDRSFNQERSFGQDEGSYNQEDNESSRHRPQQLELDDHQGTISTIMSQHALLMTKPIKPVSLVEANSPLSSPVTETAPVISGPKPVEIQPSKPGRVHTTVLRRLSLRPKREAPKPPMSKDEELEAPKENWFMKIIHSLGGSSSPNNKQNKITTINSELSSVELLEIIRTTLELKKFEGSLTHFNIDEEFGIIDGLVPSNFANGRKLKFKIEVIDMVNRSSLHLIKVKGSTKSFKNLIKIVSFIIREHEKKR
ncbi:Serine/threonine-protein kinase hsl1 [Yamadazyma tenuis]|uniref:non-specific serine/threonine protein kinase n=1 Tax=Candida tenuis (strain ATCC 10573 / BCRC 21748 / CBS 615 / JCM 9827 / NBRC 10315 / NRRL Y-1498 / VKM Y-70) TaxID=590646 RepID=G3B390_CANTC|nr:Pkinase-domain-containing protein [Yamadazyma tenuis ATCC 10573]EGV64109.1 Pkinase-domain-containing protein [Yamadazyma tenuis ATCC 10573]WEJ96254.1 Serine/threonine-protein kinase hsl1 [Yamadazyma tenuis]